MQYDKGGMFKIKKFGIRDTLTRKDEFPFVIIAIRHNETGLWSLIVLNVTHNRLPTLPGAYSIY